MPHGCHCTIEDIQNGVRENSKHPSASRKLHASDSDTSCRGVLSPIPSALMCQQALHRLFKDGPFALANDRVYHHAVTVENVRHGNAGDASPLFDHHLTVLHGNGLVGHEDGVGDM